MSSSTFEVRESESDSEKVIDFGLDTVEENGIMTTQIDGELPKDHTYTKEPDVLQEEEIREGEDSSNKLEEMDSNALSPEKPRSSRAARASKVTKKAPPKGRAKKNASPKKEAPVKKTKAKRGGNKEEVPAADADSNNVQDEKVDAEEAPAEEPPKSPKKGRKRKIEEKENLVDQNSVEEPADADSSIDESPKKKGRTAKSATKQNVEDNDSSDTHNLPKGWVRKTVMRKSGKSAGQVDVYIYSPDGYKFRSKPDIAAYLQRTKSPYKLDTFDFSKKRATENATPVKSPPKKSVVSKTSKKPSPAQKKNSKLLVKIVPDKRKSNKTTKKSEEKNTKANKSPPKGKKATSKGSKKKKTA